MIERSVSLLVNIDVDDLERGERFYTEALGLRVGRRLGTGVLELLGMDAPIYLLAKPSGSAPHRQTDALRSYARHWTPVHLDFVVPQLEPALARALAAGARAESEIADAAYGRIVHLGDPFGHGICLLEFSERGYDALVE